MRRRLRFSGWVIALVFLGQLSACAGDEEKQLLVFAAASLQDVLTELEEPFEAVSGADLRFNFAGSNTLALQLEASGRGDVFLSADEEWMDFVERSGRLEPQTRRTILSNRLVVIANYSSPFEISRLDDLADLPFRFLALGDPRAVPAGRYGRQLLEKIPVDLRGEGTSLWAQLRDRVVPCPDVRAALAWVEAEPEAVGIVYRSDAVSNERVKVLYEVSAAEGPEIRYSGAVIRGSSKAASAREFLEFLGFEAAKENFFEHGFAPLPSSSPPRMKLGFGHG